MTTKFIKHAVVPLSLCAASTALGQTSSATPPPAPDYYSMPLITLEPKPQQLNRISMGFQLGFDLRTSFKHIGRFAPATDPGPAGSFTNHVYDDGYNLVDSTGNQHFNGSGFTEGTWNWGFSGNSNPDVNGNGAQVSNNGGENGTISMHSTFSPGGSSNGKDNDPPPGLILTFSHQFFQDRKDRWRAGLQAAFGYTDYDVKDSSNVNAKQNTLTDTYSLMGTTVPTGTSYGQGNLGDPNHIIIGDTPTRTFSQQVVPVTGTREFGADIFAFRLGPYFEIPLNKTFAFSLEGGVAMVYVYSNFRYNEEVTTPGGLLNLKGNGSNQDVEFGGYIGGKISAALNDRWRLFSAADWEDVSDYVHRSHTTGESAVLNLSQAVFFTAGIEYSF